MLSIKKVKTTSGEFAIAPLTLRQVEDSENLKPLTAISVSMANAGQPMDEEQLKDNLTLVSLKELVSEVMEISGLAPVKPGEESAVETPSTTSTAA